jgi:hypothetical protein
MWHEYYDSGQKEMFTSLHDMGPNEAATLRADAKKAAEALVLELTPKAPDHTIYKKLWPAVLTKHAVRLTDVNSICAALKKRTSLCSWIGSVAVACRRATTACSVPLNREVGITPVPLGIGFVRIRRQFGSGMTRARHRLPPLRAQSIAMSGGDGRRYWWRGTRRRRARRLPPSPACLLHFGVGPVGPSSNAGGGFWFGWSAKRCSDPRTRRTSPSSSRAKPAPP